VNIVCIQQFNYAGCRQLMKTLSPAARVNNIRMLKWQHRYQPFAVMLTVQKVTTFFVLFVVVTILVVYLSTNYKQFKKSSEVVLNKADRMEFNAWKKPHRDGRYVTFPIRTTGNGLGNYMFYFAGAAYVAEMTGRQVAIISTQPTVLDEVFELGVDRFADLSPYCRVSEKTCMVYDNRFEKLLSKACTPNQTILVMGSHNSWKYTMSINNGLRRYFRFRSPFLEYAIAFKIRTVPPEWLARNLSFVRIGIHVRRGDFLAPGYARQGFTVASAMYFERAMKYFIERFDRVQFIVCSDDIKWCKQNLHAELLINGNVTHQVNIVYSESRNRGEDLALLASCDHTIISVGTYGWWSAWLANGLTVYCTDHPLPGSPNARRCKNNMSDWEYHHPAWIGMSGL